MHKIYSRARIIYARKFVKCIVILVIAFGVVIMVTNAVKPVFEALCKDEAKGLATKITNEEATKIMEKYSYQDLFSIEKDSSGNITMIKSNIFPINEITSSIAIKIQEGIEGKGKDNIKIPMGTFSGIAIFAGRGPNVNIKITPIGNVETDLKSEFSEKGINQTLHRIYLQVQCNISILNPFCTTEESITNQVLIAENVIIGKIPSNYYNLHGINSTRAIDIIE